MGCTVSKVSKAEDVTRCRARRRLMKQVVAARHQFAAAHAAYIQAMKNVGAAFRQFGETELRDAATKNTSTSQSPDRPLPPPPPPVFSPRIGFISPPSPRKQDQHEEDNFKKREEEPTFYYEKSEGTSGKGHEQEDQEEFYYTDEEKVEKVFYYTAPPPPVPSSTAPPPPSPPRTSAWDFYDPFRPAEPPVRLQQEQRQSKKQVQATVVEEEEEDADVEDDDELMSNPEKTEEQLVKNASVIGSSKRDHLAIIVMPSGGIGHKELVDVVKEVDELFLRAYECGKNVSKLLEARKVHYHSNFVDAKGYESHSKRVLQAISLHRASSKLPPKIVASEDHLSSPDEAGTTGSHAGTLDRLMAWEKKLYDEVKNTERICLEYKRKCSSFTNTQEEPSDSIKALIKDLSTKIQVSLQGVDTAITAINKIKEDELHGQLVLLIEGLMNMWNELYDCHQRQYRIVAEMKAMDQWGAVEPTTNLHRMATTQLESAVEAWYSGFNKLFSAQREYLHCLTGWLRLSNVQLDMEKARDVGDSKRQVKTSLNIPMLQLCQDWSLAMDRLPEKVASESIKSFVAVTHKVIELQNEEVKLRKKLDALAKVYNRKTASYVHFSGKRKQRSETVGEAAKEETVESTGSAETVLPSIFLRRGVKTSNKLGSGMVALKEKVEEAKEQVEKAVLNTRAMTINSLHTGLPSIFQSVTGFGRISLHAYQTLYCQAHNGALLRITQA